MRLGTWFYNLLTYIFIGLAKLMALFNNKIHAFVRGRQVLFPNLVSAVKDWQGKVIWFHCASLGEFEQGRPIMERLRSHFPNHKILLTFFSPSGYEVRKKFVGADYVSYLPFDLPDHARKFISIVNPVLAIFIKYEFWPNIFVELKNKGIPIVSASSIFRAGQSFFKFYGGRMRSTLQNVNYFFVQNEQSMQLLKSISLNNVSLSGDTRFDRVYQISQSQIENSIARIFKAGKPCWVIGSCWPEDIALLAPFINRHLGQIKFIIAPHEISEGFIENIRQSLSAISVRYSQTHADWEGANVLIVDNVGLLSQLYRYGEFAFVGGGFGKGLHNILEAAAYGIPVFFGNRNYIKFQEAIDLIEQGGAFAVSDLAEFKAHFDRLIKNSGSYETACRISKSYVETNRGATDKIVSYCEKLLKHEGQDF